MATIIISPVRAAIGKIRLDQSTKQKAKQMQQFESLALAPLETLIRLLSQHSQPTTPEKFDTLSYSLSTSVISQ
jgi:hypothetical protein